MTKRILAVVLLLLSFGAWAFAQSTVSGKVTDATGEPLVGVDVLVKGTTTGIMTGTDGSWALSDVKSGTTLVFSCIGFASQEVTVGSSKTINVVLKDDANFLDEVVFIGYGTARKKDVSGAIASVNYGDNKDISSLPNPNALAALSSKVAGMNYSPTTSASGDNSSTMTIRGMNAIPTNGALSGRGVNQPLLVVDGVLSQGSINSINTADIQSIDVLKDASAAAIYGSRAANGVIVITTKRGTSAKPVVNFQGSVSLSDWSRMPKMVSDQETFLKNRFYTQTALNASFKDKTWDGYTSLNQAAGELLTATELRAWDAIQNGDMEQVNWLDEISRTGVGQKYDVSIAGRSENINYYVSSNYTRQQGIRLGDDYEKFGALVKLDINVTKWLTVGAKVNFLNNSSWGQTARIQNATWMTPYSFVYAEQEGYENWYNSHPDGNAASPFYGSGANDSNLFTDKSSKSNSINAVTYAQIDFPFLKGLTYKVNLQGYKSASQSDVFNQPEIWVDTRNTDQMDNPSQFNSSVEGYSQLGNSESWNIDNILSYTKDFGKHHADVMIGYTREHYRGESLRASYKGFDSPTYLGAYGMSGADPSNTTLSRSATITSAVGYLARATYNYNGTYFGTFNFRRDGYSAFAEGHKWGNFFGASAAWILTNEKFIKNLNAFDFLKLRLSWGQNGSRSIAAYQTLANVSIISSNSGSMTSTWLGDQSAPGYASQGIPNKSLTWATIEKFNVGLDFAFLDNRINGNVDVYTGQTKNMIVTRSAPYFSGFTTTYDNVGKVTNDGIELTVNTVNVNGNGRDKFRWESNLIFDINRNEVKELYGKGFDGTEADDVANAIAYGFDSYYALQVGHPIGSAYDYKKLGIFNSEEEIKAYTNKNGEMIQPSAVPGDIKFEDFNDDGKIDANDRQFLGSPDPLFTVNFGNTLSWKNFSLYFNFRWAQGDKDHFLWFDPNAFGTSMGGGAQLAAVKPWTESNHSQTYPRYGYQNTEGYLYWNTRSFLKLKDLSFSYTIDPKITKVVGISNARLYVAATDLFTITNWSGLDPENAGTIAAGVSSSRYGSAGAYKTVTFGVNLTF